MSENDYFYLNRDCILVKGFCKSAVYDLSSGNIYALEELSSRVLDLCEKGCSISQISERLDIIKIDLIKHLIDLKQKGIGDFYEIFKLNKTEIEPLPIAVDLVWLEVTKACNQKCVHCYADSYANKMAEKPLSHNDWKRIIKEAAELKCKRLQFTGGEPILYGEKLFDLVELAYCCGIKSVEIFSNSTLLSDKYIDSIAYFGVKVSTNIFSSEEAIHDQVTGLGGSFKKTVGNIKKMQKKGIAVNIATVITKYNDQNIKRTIEFINGLGKAFPLLGFDIVRPAGRGKTCDVYSAKACIFSIKSKPIFAKINRFQFAKRKYGHSCWWGNVVVTNDGKLMPCIMMKGYEHGNVLEQSLSEIITKTELFNLWKLSKDKIKKCCDCEFRYACLDCRVSAMSINNVLYSECSHGL